MGASTDDPKGYYASLGISSKASAEEIKKAYQRRALETHPDKNPGRDTTREFQRVGEAYAVLSNPAKRATYDSSARVMPENEAARAKEEEQPPEFVKCSSCNVITAQPRYVIFHKVMSLILVTQRSVVQGIFCPRCAMKQGLWASIVTWLVGWWAVWGLVYSIEAVLKNMFGGDRPPGVNSKILGYQAWMFARKGEFPLARSLAAEALELAVKAKDHEQMGILGGFLRDTEAAGSVRPLKNRWPVFGANFAAQVAIPLVIAGAIYSWKVSSEAAVPPIWHSSPAVAAASPRTQTHSSPVPRSNVLEPRGTPPQPSIPTATFDISSAVPDSPRAGPPTPQPVALAPPPSGLFDHPGNPFLEAPAPFTIRVPVGKDNYFVKLVPWGAKDAFLTMFVRAGESAKVMVPLGSYQLKYAYGTTWYGEDERFGPETSYEIAGAKLDFYETSNGYMGHVVQLIPQVNGNLTYHRISKEDF